MPDEKKRLDRFCELLTAASRETGIVLQIPAHEELNLIDTNPDFKHELKWTYGIPDEGEYLEEANVIGVFLDWDHYACEDGIVFPIKREKYFR